MYQNPKYDLKFQYRRVLEVSALLSLAAVILVFMMNKKFEYDVNIRAVDIVAIQVENIPPTQIIKKVKVPLPPVIPVPSPEINPAGDIEINFREIGEFSIGEIPPPPPIDDLPVRIFKVEIPPRMIGGEQAIVDYIMRNNLFPKVASELGISGKALIGFTVSKTGIPENIHIMQEVPEGLGFGNAGMEVMRAMRFSPGFQQDKPVSVIMQQPIVFSARSR